MKPRLIDLDIKEDQEYLIERIYNLLEKYYFPTFNEPFNWEIKVSKKIKKDLYIINLLLYKENGEESYQTNISNTYLNNIISSNYKLNEFIHLNLLNN